VRDPSVRELSRRYYCTHYEIKGRDEAVVVGLGWPEFSFCGCCGKPIIAFLKKHKLLQLKTTE